MRTRIVGSAVACGLLLSALAPAAAHAIPPTHSPTEDLQESWPLADCLLREINDKRDEVGLPPVRMSYLHMRNALRHSTWMAQTGTFAHDTFERLGDRDDWDGVAYYEEMGGARTSLAYEQSSPEQKADQARYPHVSPEAGHRTIGENLGTYGSSDPNLTCVVLSDAFRNSPTHYDNEIHPDYRWVSIGAVIGRVAGSPPSNPKYRSWVTVRFASDARMRQGLGQPDEDPSDLIGDAQVLDAISQSAATFGYHTASHVVIAGSYHESFSDALGASALAGPDGPILYVAGRQPFAVSIGDDNARSSQLRRFADRRVLAEVDRVLPNGGRVYIVGGINAVSVDDENALRAAGFDVRRLSGSDRWATSVAVAQEVRRLAPTNRQMLLTNGNKFADAIIAGAYAASTRTPILLAPTDALPGSVQSWISADNPTTRYAIGGTGVLADSTLAAAGVPASGRVRGSDRIATSVAVATRLFNRPAGSAGAATDYHLSADGYSLMGWAPTLAASPWAARHDAPLLYTHLASAGANEPVYQYLRSRYAARGVNAASGLKVVGEAGQRWTADLRAALGG